MRVVMVSKALVWGMYQRKLEELAALPGVELTVAVPPYWREGEHRHYLERAYTKGYRLVTLPMALNGHYHVHLYPTLGPFLRQTRPDLVHVDEEPYNLATWHGVSAAQRAGARAVFFTWQNMRGTLPLPFELLQHRVVERSDGAIAGNHDALQIMQGLGLRKPLALIPQFGFDPQLFHPATAAETARKETPFTIGFVGRLIEIKGLLVLLRAVAELAHEGDVRLSLAGTGELRPEMERLATELGIADRLVFHGQVASTEMPALYRSFDVLALPSLTGPRWKEQFGRALVEAMLCETPVVATNSGELPNVVGDAGLIVPEGDATALAAALRQLASSPDARRRLGQRGRQRALDHYTMAAVARQTHDLYTRVLRG